MSTKTRPCDLEQCNYRGRLLSLLLLMSLVGACTIPGDSFTLETPQGTFTLAPGQAKLGELVEITGTTAEANGGVIIRPDGSAIAPLDGRYANQGYIHRWAIRITQAGTYQYAPPGTQVTGGEPDSPTELFSVAQEPVPEAPITLDPGYLWTGQGEKSPSMGQEGSRP